MNTDKQLVAGSKMISDLISNSDYDCFIKREYVKNDGCYVNYNDGGAVVRMNDWTEEGNNWHYMVSDGVGGSMKQYHKNVAHIILGHELIHATHNMNGTLANPTRTVYRYINSTLQADRRGSLNVSEEYNTVGLAHIVEIQNQNGSFRVFYLPMPGELNENTLRKEQKATWGRTFFGIIID